MKRIKIITSHAGLSRFVAETSEEPIGFMARITVAHIPSPFHYSPVKAVWGLGKSRIAWFETGHKRYEVYELEGEKVFETEAEAEEENFKATGALT